MVSGRLEEKDCSQHLWGDSDLNTTRETVKLLCKSIITRLENTKSICFPHRLRHIVQDEVYGLIGSFVVSEEDIRDRALAKLGAKAELLADTQFTESEQYQTAKKMIRGGLKEHELNGFYFQKPLKSVAEIIVQYLMRSSHIDDVFETDQDLECQIVDIVRNFDANKLH